MSAIARLLLATGLLLGVGMGTARAQPPPPIDSYQIRYYVAGTATLAGADSFPATQALCNQAPLPILPNVTNPTISIWDDPINPGQVCIWTSSPQSAVQTLPAGSYEAAAVAIAVGVSSDESNRDLFQRVPVIVVRPVAPLHFHVRKR